jgi:hypothetical protein
MLMLGKNKVIVIDPPSAKPNSLAPILYSLNPAMLDLPKFFSAKY